MVRLSITDTTAVAVAGETISGPCDIDVASVAHGSETITSGVVVVQAGAMHRVAEMHPQSQAIMPLGVIVCFALGLFWARYCSP